MNWLKYQGCAVLGWAGGKFCDDLTDFGG
jgi:hypothetical protein